MEQEHPSGPIEIGDFIVTKYARENAIASAFTDLARLPSTDDKTALELERTWKYDPSPEILVCSYATLNGMVYQKTKELVPHPDRLHMIEYQNPRWATTLKRISQWCCKDCPYGSDSLPHHRISADDGMMVDQSFPLFITPSTCLLEMLSDDIFFTLASHLPSESLLALCQAYPRFRYIVEFSHELLRRELTCFFLRTPLESSVLGIGISLDSRSRILSSDFDWLSEDAYVNHNVRTSIQKRYFQHFLPLAFSRLHFERVQPRIWERLVEIDRAVREAESDMNSRNGRNSNRPVAPPKYVHETVGVIYKMMNNIVVSLMKSCDDVLSLLTKARRRSSKATLLHASEKAVYSYCHLLHLLISLCRTTPQILEDATQRVRLFVQSPAHRLKTQVPDLGEMIVLVTLVLAHPPLGDSPVTWETLNGPFLEEATVRNVRWVLKGAPDLEVLETGQSDYRLAITFEQSKTSLRLMMFQITFLDMFVNTYASDLTILDSNYGFAEKAIPERMVEEVKEIYKVDAWPGFFERVKYSRGRALGAEKFSEMLRHVMKLSGERGYHTPTRPRDLHLMSRNREVEEGKWRRNQKK